MINFKYMTEKTACEERHILDDQISSLLQYDQAPVVVGSGATCSSLVSTPGTLKYTTIYPA